MRKGKVAEKRGTGPRVGQNNTPYLDALNFAQAIEKYLLGNFLRNEEKTITNEEIGDLAKKTVYGVLERNNIKTPQELYKTYISYKLKGLPPINLGITSTTTTKVIANFFHHRSKEFNVTIYRKISDEHFRDYFLLFEDMSSRLTSKTLKEIWDNYSFETIIAIIEALIDFESSIVASMCTQDILSSTKKAYKKKQQAGQTIKAINILQKNPHLTETGLREIKRIKYENEKLLKTIKEFTVSPVNVTQLKSLINTKISGFGATWQKTMRLQLNNFILKQPQGRPKDIFFKALQIIIYKLLTLKKPVKIKSYIKWSQKLTADIINEAYKDLGLPKLTSKHIDNLHSA